LGFNFKQIIVINDLTLIERVKKTGIVKSRIEGVKKCNIADYWII
jgi:hypothetical protein